MVRSIFSKVMWVGRATVFLLGLAVILAAVMGMASMALAANGKPFILGKSNIATKVSKLAKSGVGPALDLRVDSGPPLAVNSDERVANLNADEVDGKSAGEIGVNGLERVEFLSATNSESPKSATAGCSAGKVVVGTGYEIFGGKNGQTLNARTTDIVIDRVTPGSVLSSVTVVAYEEEPTSADWDVTAYAICATAP